MGYKKGGTTVVSVDYSQEIETINTQLAHTTNEIERLDSEKATKQEMNSSLSVKADLSYVNNQLNDIGISQINKNKGKIDQTYLSEDLLQQIAGNAPINAVPADNSLDTRKYIDKSVTVDKTNFAKRGRNKFNGVFETGVILTDGTFSNAPGMLAIIPVTGGKSYYIRKDSGNRRRVGFHKTLPSLTSSSQTLDYYIGDLGVGDAAIAPSDAKYMLFFASTTSVEIQMQVTEDEDPPFFIGYDVDLLLKKESQPIDVLIESEKIKDTINSRQALLYGNSPILKINYSDKTVTVTSSARVFFKGKRHVANTAVLAWTGSELQAIYFDPATNNIGLHRIQIGNTLDPNYVLLGILNPVYRELYGIDIELCEIDGEMFIYPQTKTYVDNKIATIPTTKYFFLDDIQGIYDKPSDLESVSTGQTIDLVASKHTIIYDIFDALVAAYQNYVTRTKLGDDESGLPIYQYKFTAPAITNESSRAFKKAKIIVVSGVHGYEKGSAWCTAQFFKDLCENWAVKPQLEFMRFNIDFVVVPVVNPYGFDNNQRTNYNLVDINRNFSSNWIATGTHGDPDGYYSGPSAASEIETQIMQDFVDANTDAEYLVDYHNIASGYPLFYVFDSVASTIGLSTFRTLTRKWKNDYPSAPQDVTMFGYVKNAPTATLNDYARSKGIKTFTLETPWKMPFASAKYDKVTVETGVDTLGNTLVTLCKSLK